MRVIFQTILLSFLLSGCGQSTSTTDVSRKIANDTAEPTVLSESERLNQWFEEKYEEALMRSPISLTELGRKERYDEIDDYSDAALDEQLRLEAEAVAQLQAEFDYDALTLDAKVSYDSWIAQYEAAKARAPFRLHNYNFNQMFGAHTRLPNFMINNHTVANEYEMQAYIARIGGISRMIDQVLERTIIAASENIRPPYFAYEAVIQQSLALITGAPFDEESDIDSPLFADAKAKIKTLVDTDEITEDQGIELLTETEAALLGSFEPAYLSLIQWMQEDYVNVDEQARGVSSLPDGEAFYTVRLANQTTTDMTAEEIHTLGISEVARIHEEMEALKESVAFEGSLQDFFIFIRSDRRFNYANDDEGRQAYLDESTDYISTIRQKLPEYFGRLPKAELDVKRVEAFREQDGGAAHYQPGTPDGSRNGTFYAHLSDMTSFRTTNTQNIAYHEGIPGHHMQLSIAQELEGIPEFRKNYWSISYIEGWGLYAEKLAKEMGAYEDPYNDFGRLSGELWRAIRLVLDTGIHVQGWTEQQAIEYARENSAKTEGEIRSEVQRYFVMPGQATTYKIGMLKFLELREKAMNVLDEDFDIREFHDTVLGGGALPLSVLEQVVDNWIATY